MTLFDWCVQNNRIDIIERWDNERNSFFPHDVPYRSHRVVYIKCGRGLHESSSCCADRLVTRRKDVCMKCCSFAQYLIDTVGEEKATQMWSDKNTISPWRLYANSRQLVWLTCLQNDQHKEYAISCNQYHNTPGSGCPYCHVRGTHGVAAPCDSILYVRPECKKYYSAKNTIDPSILTIKSHQKVWWECELGLHKPYLRCVAESVRYDFRCPFCSADSKESMLEAKVYDYLTGLGYSVNKERACSIIYTQFNNDKRHSCPYDNEVVELKLIVEVNGKQHYSICSWHTKIAKRNKTTPEYELQKQQIRDEEKRRYAIDCGYYFLAIPYTAFDEKNTYIELINEKINSILSEENP